VRAGQDGLDAGAAEREVWIHGDLLPGNLLLTGGRLSAVIDFGGLNVGDPACELQAAWNVFTGTARARYFALRPTARASWALFIFDRPSTPSCLACS